MTADRLPLFETAPKLAMVLFHGLPGVVLGFAAFFIARFFQKGVRMRSSTPAVLLLTCALLASSVEAATARGTPAEAKAMLEKAVEHFKAAGREHALPDFTAAKAPFHDRDLYVLCVDAKHVIAANGGYASYVGSSADDFVDSKGVPLGKALWEAAGKNPSGSIEYPHVNPATKKIEDKTTFYSKVADDLLCGVGAYSAH